MTKPVFLVDAERLRGSSRVLLDGEEGHHAAAVRRLAPGAELVLTDGAGHLAECVVVGRDRHSLRCDVRVRYDVPAPQPRLVVVQALAKGSRDELAVELLTEVGADVIVPWAASRCIVQWRGDRGDRALAKWASTAREAAKQSRRAWLPHIRPLANLADVVGLVAGAALSVVLHETGGQPVAALDVPPTGDVVLVIGPEGGITDDELAALVAAGAYQVRLGPTVLRTSTAGVVAAAAVLSRTQRWR